MLTLTLFGSARAEATGRAHAASATLLTGKPLALLAYLSCAPGRATSRGRLVDLLWSDVDPDDGKHALRQTLWYLKRRLGDDCVASDGDHLRLTPSAQVDRDAFVAAIAVNDLAAAVSAYSGDFFPGFAAPGGAEFERWADVERAHLRGLFVRAADDLARTHLSHGNARAAVALARRARDADPDNEATWRLLLEALLAVSDRIGAASEADALERRTADDERDVEPATRALLRTVRQADHAPEPRADARTLLVAELVARELEFSAIIQAWERARSASAEHVHLTAPAGLGKTRMLADIEARLRGTRARVVRLRAAPGERAMPYALAAELAAALARLRGAVGVSSATASVLVGLNPAVSTWLNAVPDSAVGDDVLRRRTLAILELLQAVAGETPLALLIDDVHWSDDASRQLLVGVASRLGNSATLLVTASRPPSPFPTDGSTVRVLPLVPLDATQVGTLVASIALLPNEAWSDRLPSELHAATGGSPLMVLEMLQFALDHGRLRVEEGRWACDDPSALVTDLRPGRAVERRIAELGSSARLVLAVLALAGVPISARTVADALDRTPEDSEAILLRLEQAGLAAREGSGWLPQHDEIASAAVAAADEDSRRMAHRGLATAFALGPRLELPTLRRALSHAVASGDDALLSRMARDYVALARARGDSRRSTALLHEAFGTNASPALVRGLMATLPWNERLAWRRPARYAVTGAALLTLAVIAYGALRPPPRVANNALLMRVITPSDTLVYEVDVDDALASSSMVDVSLSQRASAPLVQALSLEHAHERPDRGGWAGWRMIAADSNNLEIVVSTRDGFETRIASDREDDVRPSWSPDQRYLVFLTRRWDAQRGSDIALADLASGAVRQLTATVEDENDPSFSPDGTRILFLRTSEQGGLMQACTFALDGAQPRCHLLHGNALSSHVYPLDGGSLAVSTMDGGTARLLRLDMETGDTVRIDSGAVSYTLSPDGSLVLADYPDDASGGAHRILFLLRDPTHRVLVTHPNGRLGRTEWRASRTPQPSLNHFTVEQPSDVLPIELPSRLRYRSLDGAGRAIAIPAPRWWSLDSAIATVDERGGVTPLRQGSARLVASAGGYREDTVELTFATSISTTLLDEQWSGGVTDRWEFFGDPSPRLIQSSPGDSAMLLAGDRTFDSGLFSTARADAARGGGAEVRFSIPLTEAKWQSFSVTLRVMPTATILRAWRERDAGIPSEFAEATQDRICSAALPSKEGATDRVELSFAMTSEVASLPMAATLTDGSWHRLLLQIFPDGRCGVALDGRALWISRGTMRQDLPVSLVVSGRSVNTRVQLGRARMWKGVDPVVRWTVVGPSPQPRTASRH